MSRPLAPLAIALSLVASSALFADSEPGFDDLSGPSAGAPAAGSQPEAGLAALDTEITALEAATEKALAAFGRFLSKPISDDGDGSGSYSRLGNEADFLAAVEAQEDLVRHLQEAFRHSVPLLDFFKQRSLETADGDAGEYPALLERNARAFRSLTVLQNVFMPAILKTRTYWDSPGFGGTTKGNRTLHEMPFGPEALPEFLPPPSALEMPSRALTRTEDERSSQVTFTGELRKARRWAQERTEIRDELVALGKEEGRKIHITESAAYTAGCELLGRNFVATLRHKASLDTARVLLQGLDPHRASETVWSEWDAAAEEYRQHSEWVRGKAIYWDRLGPVNRIRYLNPDRSPPADLLSFGNPN